MKSKTHTYRILSFVSLLAGLTISAHAWVGNSTVTSLSSPGGEYGEALGINATGQVTGAYNDTVGGDIPATRSCDHDGWQLLARTEPLRSAGIELLPFIVRPHTWVGSASRYNPDHKAHEVRSTTH